LAVLAGMPSVGHDLLRADWARRRGKSIGVDNAWTDAVQRGIVAGSAISASAPAALTDAVNSALRTLVASAHPAPNAGALEIVFAPSRSVYDGRFADNPWLQELPDPITKL